MTPHGYPILLQISNPVWASLAWNYLSIMASSVSTALTITKRHNQLKGDVVEAIQVLRMLYNRSLMFREPAPSSALELMYEEEKEGAITESTEAEDELDFRAFR
ncbi:hypothetical protein BU15DRAFT_64690 [Melanogaster broomeanus]|nr:hypothetical protein BU15DRAFT_64690 [Melanogaster broomeanus]